MQTRSADAFADLVRAAVADFAEHGFDSEHRLEEWLMRLRAAAEREAMPQHQMEQELRQALGSVYARLIDREEILRRHQGISRFTLAQVKPTLRLELNRRILASANLIKLNRERAITDTLQRFSGWATSVPPGGSEVLRKREATLEIRRSITSLPYRERRVAIDQGHKFAANLSEILAVDGGAIAGIWKQHHTRYPRKAHTERDGKTYMVRGNWAQEAGLVKPGPAGYTDEITKPGEEVFCRCTYTYLYSVRQLPPEMLTAKGRAELERVRKEIAA